MTKYKQNVVEIATLEEDPRKLAQSDETDVEPAEIEKANERNELKRQLNDLHREIKSKRDELHLLDLNIHHGAYPTEADLKSLQEFFPGANLAKLVEIEKFHTKIQAILGEELEAAHTHVTKLLATLEEQAADLLARIDSIPTSKAFTDEFLDAYTELDRASISYKTKTTLLILAIGSKKKSNKRTHATSNSSIQCSRTFKSQSTARWKPSTKK